MRQQSGITKVNEDAKADFHMTEQITGRETIFEGLFQMQAGEIVFFEWSESQKEWRLSPERYYRYLMREPEERDGQRLLERLDAATRKAFERLCKHAGGKTIVIPLSGGYDSRLIALMLKELGYPNIMAFSYGAKGNEDAAISREVADALGIPWLFVEYDIAERARLLHSQEMKEYQKYAGNYASLPHTQDWYAVRHIRRNGLVPDDSVFVGGYLGDALSGYKTRRYPQAYREDAPLEEGVDTLADYLLRLTREASRHGAAWRNGRERLRAAAGDLGQYIHAASLFVCGDIAERQAKFITNAVRVYEFWGYDWWTPFWDSAFMDFWASVPLEALAGQKLYLEYITLLSKKRGLFAGNELKRAGAQYAETGAVARLNTAFNKSTWLSQVKNIIKARIPYQLRFYLMLRQHRAITGLFTKEELALGKKAGALYPYGISCACNIAEILEELEN